MRKFSPVCSRWSLLAVSPSRAERWTMDALDPSGLVVEALYAGETTEVVGVNYLPYGPLKQDTASVMLSCSANGSPTGPGISGTDSDFSSDPDAESEMGLSAGTGKTKCHRKNIFPCLSIFFRRTA